MLSSNDFVHQIALLPQTQRSDLLHRFQRDLMHCTAHLLKGIKRKHSVPALMFLFKFMGKTTAKKEKHMQNQENSKILSATNT